MAGEPWRPEPSANAARDERLRAWLIRVTVNECKSLWRSLWRQRVELREIRDGDAPPFEESAFAEPAHEALYAALGTLPEKCRIVVHLFYFEDMGTRRDRRGAGHQGTHGAHPARPSKETTETVTEGGVGR